jgi:hypothetical protein
VNHELLAAEVEPDFDDLDGPEIVGYEGDNEELYN